MLMSFVAFLGFFVIAFSLNRVGKRYDSFHNRFKLRFSFELSIYLMEIAIVFMLFQIFLHFFGESLGYKREGILKEFIDLFTVYQIFLFVVLKLYDSYKLEPYIGIQNILESIEMYVAEGKKIPQGLEMAFLAVREYSGQYAFLDGLNIERLLEDYEKFRLMDTEPAKERVEAIRYEIDNIKSSVKLNIEYTNSHLNLSILRRIRFTSQISKTLND
ncbi:hypothetical protein [Exiguobacterium sp. s142]|uniref:hypothetical protein n=1 Tax=Exiguobacterium sp. s142 TaxID=2751222 RepID=UPI001BE8BEB2|nr:hypothetical protein [Exiguobacterium sp. s142]